METMDEKEEMKTLSSVMNKLTLDGYTENFVVDENGMHSANSDKRYRAGEVKIINFYRFEGESDPSDNAILYALEASDGKKGMLSDAFGSYADKNVTKFISRIEEIHKVINDHPHAT